MSSPRVNKETKILNSVNSVNSVNSINSANSITYMYMLYKIASEYIHQNVGIHKFTNYNLQNTPKNFHQLASLIAVSYYDSQNINDLETNDAYETFKKEIKQHFLSLTNAGFKIKPFTSTGQP